MKKLFLWALIVLFSSPSFAQVATLSDLSNGGLYNSTTDTLVGIRNGTTDLQMSLNSLGNFNVKDYGAKCNGVILTDITTTNGSPNISSTSSTFTSSMVGYPIVISSGSNNLLTIARGTITSVSGNTAVMSANATANATANARATFGFDDTSAIQSSINAANPVDSCTSSCTWQYRTNGTVVLPQGICMVTSPLLIRTNVSFNGQGDFSSTLKWASTHAMGTGYEGLFVGLNANGSTRIYTNNKFSNFELDDDAAFTITPIYISKCIDAIYVRNPKYTNLYWHGSPATCVGMDYVISGSVTDNLFKDNGHLWANSGGGSHIDWQTSGGYGPESFAVESAVISNNIFIGTGGASAVRTTDNSVSNVPSNVHRIIANNVIIWNSTTGKCLEDSGGIGVTIIGNHCYNIATQTTGYAAISVQYATKGLIADNVIQGGWWDGIAVSNFVGASPAQYSIRGNTVTGAIDSGIYVDEDSGNTLDTLNVTDNYVSGSGSAGVNITNTGTGGTINNLTLSGNTLSNNGKTTGTDNNKSGILINTNVVGLIESNNYAFDNSTSTQKYGQTIASGITVTNAAMNGNHFNNNTTLGCNFIGIMTGWISENFGASCNSLGISAITPGGSPWNYTAGSRPEVLYLIGGTVSNVQKNSITLATSLSPTQSLAIYLNPGESVLTTYTVAPTASTDKK